MDEILNTRIKELIGRYPEVGNLLNEFGVACVACAVGTCLLKDILEIHRLTPEDEQRMMTRIAGILYPDRRVEIPLRKKEHVQDAKGPSFSPPMKMLVNEHKLIKRLLVVLPAMIRGLDLGAEEGRQVALSGVDFIRSFADRYHHAKEEDILFKCFDENLDILKVMLEDHEAGRAHVRAVLDAVRSQDTAAAGEHLMAYRELLTEHIKKEDEVLYPWLDRQLSDAQVGRLFAAFNEVNEPLTDAHLRGEVFVQQMEQRFTGAERRDSRESA